MFGCFELKLILEKVWYALDNFCFMDLLLLMYCWGIIIVVIVLVVGFLFLFDDMFNVLVVMCEVQLDIQL